MITNNETCHSAFRLLFNRSLRCLRNAIHCHLIVAFIIKNILWIIMHQTLNYLQHPSYSVSILHDQKTLLDSADVNVELAPDDCNLRYLITLCIIMTKYSKYGVYSSSFLLSLALKVCVSVKICTRKLTVVRQFTVEFKQTVSFSLTLTRASTNYETLNNSRTQTNFKRNYLYTAAFVRS